MGIVQSQSIKNTIITFFGFGIGAINALFLYTNFLGKLHYGIVATLLSGANIMMPLMAFGVQNTLIRFFSHYKTEKEKGEHQITWNTDAVRSGLYIIKLMTSEQILTQGIAISK